MEGVIVSPNLNPDQCQNSQYTVIIWLKTTFILKFCIKNYEDMHFFNHSEDYIILCGPRPPCERGVRTENVILFHF